MWLDEGKQQLFPNFTLEPVPNLTHSKLHKQEMVLPVCLIRYWIIHSSILIYVFVLSSVTESLSTIQ